MGCNSSKNDTTAISAPIPAPATETKAISNEVHTNEQTPIKVENIILEPSDISGVEKSEDKIENENSAMDSSAVTNSENAVKQSESSETTGIEEKGVVSENILEVPEIETAIEKDINEIESTIIETAPVVTEAAPVESTEAAPVESVTASPADGVAAPHVESTNVESAPAPEPQPAPEPEPEPELESKVEAVTEVLPPTTALPVVEEVKEVVEENAVAAPAESESVAEKSTPASSVEDAHVELTAIETEAVKSIVASSPPSSIDSLPAKESTIVETASPAPVPVSAPVASPSSKSSPPVVKMGYINKLGQEYKTWKKRFFVLKDGILTYYEKDQKQSPFGVNHKGEVCLRHMVFEEKNETVTMTSDGKGDRDLILKIASPKERAEWLDAMKAHAAFYFK